MYKKNQQQKHHLKMLLNNIFNKKKGLFITELAKHSQRECFKKQTCLPKKFWLEQKNYQFYTEKLFSCLYSFLQKSWIMRLSKLEQPVYRFNR